MQAKDWGVAMGAGLLVLAFAAGAQAQTCGNFTTYAKSVDPDQCRPAAQLEAEALNFCGGSGGSFVHDFHPDKPCSQNPGNFQDGSFHCCSTPDRTTEQFVEGGKDQCRSNEDWIELAKGRCGDLGKKLTHWQVSGGCNRGHHLVNYTCSPAEQAPSCQPYAYDANQCFADGQWESWAGQQCQGRGDVLGSWHTSNSAGCGPGGFTHADYQCCPASSACSWYHYQDNSCYAQNDWRGWVANQCQQRGQTLAAWQTSNATGCSPGSFRHGDYQCCTSGPAVSH